MDELNETLSKAIAAARSDPAGALTQIDQAILSAGEGNEGAVARLGRHAGVIAQNSGDKPRALAYFELSVKRDPEDAFLHLAIGQLLLEFGERTRGPRDSFEVCHDRARSE